MPRTMQASFASGEITPALQSRVDAAQYQGGLALAENWLVSIYGGLQNRPGTRFVYESNRDSRLIPFQLGESGGYALEFGDGLLRFYTNGGLVLLPPTSATINPTVTPGAASDSGVWHSLSSGTATISTATAATQVAQNVGTLIGDLVGGSGLAAAFNGQTYEASASCAYADRYYGAVGKHWSAAKQVVGFTIWASADLGFSGASQRVTLQLQGSNSDFAYDSTTLVSFEVTDAPGFATGYIDTSAAALSTPSFTSHRVAVFGAPGAPRLAVAEVQFFENVTSPNGIGLVGAAGSRAHAEQMIRTNNPGQPHVLTWYQPKGQVRVQIGHTSGGFDYVYPVAFDAGWHTFAFVPQASPFFLQFISYDPSTLLLSNIGFLGSGASAPVELSLPQPYTNANMPAVRYTQDANRLSLTHPLYQPLELRRGVNPLSWDLAFKAFGPKVSAPADGFASVDVRDGGATPITGHTYCLTFISADGEESLPGPSFAATAAATLTASAYINIKVGTLPENVAAVQLYKLYGGQFGLMGLFVTEFDDVGQAPQVDQAPPAERQPYPDGLFPACCAYWEQRFGLAGSDGAPETVELSKPGAAHNFSRSNPARDDDAITFTPAGASVRRIKHMLSSTDLAMFCEGSVVVARRGQNALTPALEGGVRQVAARGISDVRPLLISGSFVFVAFGGQVVRTLNADYVDSELSLPSEHLFRGRTVVDWAYQEVPYSVLWLVMSDGDMVAVALEAQQGVAGWTRITTNGLVQSVAVVREGGGDRLYLRCKRWLRGAWRQTVEILGERTLANVRDAFFVDCGLSYDAPRAIVNMSLAATATITCDTTGFVVGDYLDIDDTGIDGIDGYRFQVVALSGQLVVLDKSWDGLGPWRGGGVVRRCVTQVGGLTHLEGETVAVLNTGNVERQKVVSGGKITLDDPGSRVHVGLPFASRGKTLQIAEQPEGFGRYKAVREVQVLTRDTRALEFGSDFVTMDTPPARSGTERFNEPVGLTIGTLDITVTGKWGLGGQLCFRQKEPLPAEILSIMPIYERSNG